MVFKSTQHIKEANTILNNILYIMGVLSGIAIIGGILGIIFNSLSPSQIDFLGVTVSTGHVGVAFVSLGLISMYFVVKNVLNCTQKLGEIKEK